MKRKLALVGTLVLGLAIGGLIGGAEKTRIVTRTKTVVETTTVSVTHAKPVVPAACGRAIAVAREYAGTAGAAVALFGQVGPMVVVAARDGATGDTAGLNALGRRGLRLTATLNRLARRVKAEAVAFNADAAGCR